MSLLESTLANIPSAFDENIGAAVRNRWDSLTKPRGSLGVLEASVMRLAGIQGTMQPDVDRQVIYVFCGDHGIVAEGVSAYPSVVTREMAKNFVRGGAAINVLCRSLSIESRIIDAGIAGPKIEGVEDRRVGPGTANFALEPAMSLTDARQALESGIDLAAHNASRARLTGVGEMGIGNSTAATALLCAVAGLSPQETTGRGTGLGDHGLAHKRKVIANALAFHKVRADDPMRLLATFGGYEIAMMAGFLLGAASHRLPVVVDGFISGAACLIAHAFSPAVLASVFLAHESAEPGHRHLLTYLGVRPLLSLDMRLGEGTGAALAMQLLRSAVALYDDMATFAEASVTDALGSARPGALN